LLPLLPWCSVSNPPLSLVSFRTPCTWAILRGRSIETRDTCSDEVPMKYPLGQERIIVLKYVSIAKAWCFTDQCSMITEMLWALLVGRSRTNFPHQHFHSQLFCKIASYFCHILYIIHCTTTFVFCDWTEMRGRTDGEHISYMQHCNLT
jgi:hypothetical protein